MKMKQNIKNILELLNSKKLLSKVTASYSSGSDAL